MEINFKTYIGTKTIKATPMGANDAIRYGAAITQETANKNIGNDGYLIDYPDGYRSWSPKKTFEAAYKVAETHVDRMKIELADLNERICKAVNTLCGCKGDLLERKNEPYWVSLREQVNIMLRYMDILQTRIQQELCKTDDRKEANNGN